MKGINRTKERLTVNKRASLRMFSLPKRSWLYKQRTDKRSEDGTILNLIVSFNGWSSALDVKKYILGFRPASICPLYPEIDFTLGQWSRLFNIIELSSVAGANLELIKPDCIYMATLNYTKCNCELICHAETTEAWLCCNNLSLLFAYIELQKLFHFSILSLFGPFMLFLFKIE